MRLEFEARGRLRTSETPPKRAPVAPRWGCDGGNAPDANTSCRRLARCANGHGSGHHRSQAHRSGMHARSTKFAWRLGQARAFVASSKASRRCSRSAPTPTRRKIHGAGAGCTTLATTAKLVGKLHTIAGTRAKMDVRLRGQANRSRHRDLRPTGARPDTGMAAARPGIQMRKAHSSEQATVEMVRNDPARSPVKSKSGGHARCFTRRHKPGHWSSEVALVQERKRPFSISPQGWTEFSTVINISFSPNCNILVIVPNSLKIKKKSRPHTAAARGHSRIRSHRISSGSVE